MWIDITVLFRDGMVRWPDNPPVHVTRVQDLERGDDCNLLAISLGVRSGTHIGQNVLHRLFAKIMIDAENVRFVKIGRERAIQLPR